MVCNYCFGTRENVNDWHDCPQAQAAKAKIDASVEAITRIGTQGHALSEPWDVGRKKRLGDVAQNIKLRGGQVKPRGWDGRDE